MKKVKIAVSVNNIFKDKDKYFISFGRNNRLYFSSKRKAEDYSRKFSSDTDEILRGCLNLQSKVYGLYLSHYMEMSGFHCNNMDNQFKNLNKGLSYCFHEFSSGNQSMAVSAVWGHINNVEQTITKLREWAKKYNKYNVFNECNSLMQIHGFLNNRFYDLTNHGLTIKTVKRSTLKIVHKIDYSMTS